jgi:hypothetical protein
MKREDGQMNRQGVSLSEIAANLIGLDCTHSEAGFLFRGPISRIDIYEPTAEYPASLRIVRSWVAIAYKGMPEIPWIAVQDKEETIGLSLARFRLSPDGTYMLSGYGLGAQILPPGDTLAKEHGTGAIARLAPASTDPLENLDELEALAHEVQSVNSFDLDEEGLRQHQSQLDTLKERSLRLAGDLQVRKSMYALVMGEERGKQQREQERIVSFLYTFVMSKNASLLAHSLLNRVQRND